MGSDITMATLHSQAQQGDPQAIATLLQIAFPVQLIQVTAQIRGRCLILHLRALDSLEQAPTLIFLENWFNRLKPAEIQVIQAQIQRQG